MHHNNPRSGAFETHPVGNNTSGLHSDDTPKSREGKCALANTTLKLGIIIELVTVPCAPRKSPEECHGEEEVVKCTHRIIDKLCGISKKPVDEKGHERPAALDDAGGCPLASIVAGSPLTVVVGGDTDVPTVGVVKVTAKHNNENSHENDRHPHVVSCNVPHCKGKLAESSASHEFCPITTVERPK